MGNLVVRPLAYAVSRAAAWRAFASAGERQGFAQRLTFQRLRGIQRLIRADVT
jgi:hypothetical protein